MTTIKTKKKTKQNKTKKTKISDGENVEKSEPLGGNVKWCNCFEKQYGGSSKN